MDRSSSHKRDAYTLIELLVVIGVIAVLLGIALPVIARVRASAQSVNSSANARTLHGAIASFSEANQERYPYVTEGVLYPTFSYDMLVAFPYWHVFKTWSGVIYDFLPYREHVDVYLSPGARLTRSAGGFWPSSYHYSTSFVGDPRLWAPGSSADPAFQRRVRTSEVAFPSQKVLLWDDEAPYLRGRMKRVNGDPDVAVSIAFADGSVRLLKPTDAEAAAWNPFGGPVQNRRLHNTPQGVKGIDY